MSTVRPLRVEMMGVVPYEPMRQLQLQRRQAVAAGEADDTLFVVEHPAVITLGNRKGSGNLLAPTGLLEERGIEVIASERGGDITYHGPGQLVVYPVMHLQEGERDIKGYVWRLEEMMIQACAHFGIQSQRVDGLRGLWVGNNKIGAVGVRLSNWLTLHGFALNVSTNLDDFSLIVPCGLQGRGVTSLAKELGDGNVPTLAQVADLVMQQCGKILDRKPYHAVSSDDGGADARMPWTDGSALGMEAQGA